MATPTEPATSAIFRALRSVDVDLDLAYEAAEESRRQAGENVIAAIGAKITELKAGIDTQGARIEAQITEIKAEIKAQTARIDVLRLRRPDAWIVGRSSRCCGEASLCGGRPWFRVLVFSSRFDFMIAPILPSGWFARYEPDDAGRARHRPRCFRPDW